MTLRNFDIRKNVTDPEFCVQTVVLRYGVHYKKELKVWLERAGRFV